MNVPRLLMLSLLAGMCSAPVLAQSLPSPKLTFPTPSTLFTQPSLNGSFPTWDSRDQMRKLSLNPRDRRFRLGQDPPTLYALNRPTVALSIQPRILSAPQPERCYTVRAYRFTRETASDATTFTDYYACEPAGQFHLKGATR
jgi:hypothetical protein